MSIPLKILIIVVIGVFFIYINDAIRSIRKKRSDNAFNKIVDIMNNVNFEVSKYNENQLQQILVQIAKRIYIPSWYTREDIRNMFMLHGVSINSCEIDSIFDNLIKKNPVVTQVTSVLWNWVHDSIKIGD